MGCMSLLNVQLCFSLFHCMIALSLLYREFLEFLTPESVTSVERTGQIEIYDINIGNKLQTKTPN